MFTFAHEKRQKREFLMRNFSSVENLCDLNPKSIENFNKIYTNTYFEKTVRDIQKKNNFRLVPSGSELF